MNAEHLTALRQHELDVVTATLASLGIHQGRLLEIGAGTGEQARVLSARGYEVTAIDLADSRYAASRVWPVIDYDGLRLPFADHSFRIVFSSNVLEHVTNTDRMQQEIRRVLTPDGIAIHVLPSPVWRVLTQFTHYPWLLKTLLSTLVARLTGSRPPVAPTPQPRQPRIATRSIWHRAIYANRHGEHGNALTEASHFRRARWTRVFSDNDFEVIVSMPSGLLYSGYALLGERLGIQTRERMAALFGSACHVFVLRPRRSDTSLVNGR